MDSNHKNTNKYLKKPHYKCIFFAYLCPKMSYSMFPWSFSHFIKIFIGILFQPVETWNMLDGSTNQGQAERRFAYPLFGITALVIGIAKAWKHWPNLLDGLQQALGVFVQYWIGLYLSVFLVCLFHSFCFKSGLSRERCLDFCSYLYSFVCAAGMFQLFVSNAFLSGCMVVLSLYAVVPGCDNYLHIPTEQKASNRFKIECTLVITIVNMFTNWLGLTLMPCMS